MTLLQRVKAPTPRFYKKLRNAGLTLAGVGTTLLGLPVSLPLLLQQVAGYLVVAGSVASAICQTTSDTRPNKPEVGYGR